MTPTVPSSLRYPPPQAEWLALGILLTCLAGWAIVRIVQRRRGGRSSVVVAVTLALAVFTLTESALRLQEHYVPTRTFRPDAQQWWTLTPNLRDHPYVLPASTTLISTNDLGLREVEVSPERRPGEVRILCLGDSWTFGQGLPAEASFPKRLQAILRQRHPGRLLTVVNAGQPGYSWYQGYYFLDHLLPIYKPDIVLLCGFNEYSNEQIPEMEEALPEDSLATRIQLGLRESLLYLVLRKQVLRFTEDPAVPQDSPDGSRAKASREATDRYLRAVTLKALGSGAAVVVFDHAFKKLGAQQGDYALLEPPVAGQVIRAELCPLPPGGAPPMLDADRTHPNREGHERMARALARLLEERMPGRLAPAPATGSD